ncbi:MAG: sulfite exporter TauE/SafE family protein [Bdellovibrionota bacterium]
MTVLGYLCMLLVGVSLGMLGGGGSILTVPILTYLFGLDAVHATAYSLFIVGLSAAVGAVGKMKQGNVKPKVGALLAIPGFLGVFLSRAFLIPLLPTHVFALNDFVLTKDMFIMMIFAIMMLAASYSMIRGRRNTSSRDSTAKPMHHGKIIFGGFLIGVLTGFVGAGGFMIIPAF